MAFIIWISLEHPEHVQLYFQSQNYFQYNLLHLSHKYRSFPINPFDFLTPFCYHVTFCGRSNFFNQYLNYFELLNENNHQCRKLTLDKLFFY